MRACACDTAARLCVRAVLCSSAFSLAPPLRSTSSAVAEAALFARFFATSGRSDFSFALIVGYGLRASANVPGSTSGDGDGDLPVPSKRLLRMPGSTTTRGRQVSRDIGTGRVAFCGTENISTPNLSYAAQYLACALPCERFTSALADNPCITRGQCGSLLLHRDGLPPSAFCRSPGAPVHSIRRRHRALQDARKTRSFIRAAYVSRTMDALMSIDYSLSPISALILRISASSSALSTESVSWMATFFRTPVNLNGT